jgi:hypothetical protein
MTAKVKRSRPGLLAAWAGLLLGGLASIAANLAYAVYVQHPTYVTTIGAVLWPAFTLVGFEVIIRPAWPTNGWRAVPWWLFRLGAVAVGIVAAVSSYGNMSGLMTFEHDTWFVAHFGPGAIDGLMVTSAAALIVIERDGSPRARSPRPAPPITLTARPARPGAAWVAPPLAPPDPLAPIRATAGAIEGIRTAAARPAPARTVARVSGPPRPRPSPLPDGDRPAPAWTTRSALGPGPHPGRSRDELLVDLRAADRPDEGLPSAVAIAAHYRIKNEAARTLRDALKTDRTQDGAGGVQGEIN